MRITERFTVQHELFLQQTEMLESLLASDAPITSITAAVRTLSLPLLRHAEDEELVLFPALEDDLGAETGPLAVLVREHKTIQELLERIASEPSRDELPHVVHAFVGLLERHIAKEEDVLFPAAERILGDGRLRELDTAVYHALSR